MSLWTPKLLHCALEDCAGAPDAPPHPTRAVIIVPEVTWREPYWICPEPAPPPPCPARPPPPTIKNVISQTCPSTLISYVWSTCVSIKVWYDSSFMLRLQPLPEAKIIRIERKAPAMKPPMLWMRFCVNVQQLWTATDPHFEFFLICKERDKNNCTTDVCWTSLVSVLLSWNC